MARARCVSPEFFLHDGLAEFPPINRLMFLGLMVLADKHGVVHEMPGEIRRKILPFDPVSDADVQAMLDGLVSHRDRFLVPHCGALMIREFRVFCPKRKSNSRAYIPARVRAFVVTRDGGACRYCGAADRIELDHRLPVSRGGGDEPENLQVLCYPCNRRKAARLEEVH